MSYLKSFITFTLIFSSLGISAQQKTDYKFSFGPKEVPGYIKVEPSRVYSTENQYGFDFGTSPVAIERWGKKPLTSGFCTSDNPFFFSAALPEGNYNFKIITGDLEKPSLTTVRAESRRLIFENAVTVFLAGNSTVVDQDDDPWASWGMGSSPALSKATIKLR